MFYLMSVYVCFYACEQKGKLSFPGRQHTMESVLITTDIIIATGILHVWQEFRT